MGQSWQHNSPDRPNFQCSVGYIELGCHRGNAARIYVDFCLELLLIAPNVELVEVVNRIELDGLDINCVVGAYCESVPSFLPFKENVVQYAICEASDYCRVIHRLGIV